MFFYFLIGLAAGLCFCPFFASRSYDKGYWNGREDGYKHGFENKKISERIFGVKPFD